MLRRWCDAYRHRGYFIHLEYEPVLFNSGRKRITLLDYYLHSNCNRCCRLYRYQLIYCRGKYTFNAAGDGIRVPWCYG